MIALWVMLLPTGSGWCQPSESALGTDSLTDAEQILSFADALFQAGDYFRDITEYKRFLFVFPADPRAGRVQLQIGLAYLRGQQWEDARRTFHTIAQQHPADELGGVGQ